MVEETMYLPRHKCGLFLTHNEHRDYYMSASDWCEEHEGLQDFASEEAKARAIATDEIWILNWYPNTPIGFWSIAAPTLEELLSRAKEIEQANV
jgi:hypothetical protein